VKSIKERLRQTLQQKRKLNGELNSHLSSSLNVKNGLEVRLTKMEAQNWVLKQKVLDAKSLEKSR